MSRIANDTRSMQMALSTVSSDVFKQPVTILGCTITLFWLDWKFTLVTLVLFPTCIIPIRLFGRRARKAVQDEQKGMVQMTVTMQETFGGIRVIKSFTREEHQEKSFVQSTRQQFYNAMRMVRASEAVGPLVETIATIGIGSGAFLRLPRPFARCTFLRASGRDFSSLRADQDAEQIAYRYAAIHRRNFKDL